MTAVAQPAAITVAGPKTPIRTAASADFRYATWPQRLALAGVLWWVTYEWGPGNETLTPWLLARVIAGTDSVWVIPLAALVGFGFTAAQQLASGFTALAGFSMFDRTSRAAWNRLRGGSDTAPGEWSSLGWGARSAIVFSLGTTSVALIQIMTTGEVGVRRHRRVVATSALLCATLVGALGAMAAGVGARRAQRAGTGRLDELDPAGARQPVVLARFDRRLDRRAEGFSRSVTEPPQQTRDRPPDRYAAAWRCERPDQRPDLTLVRDVPSSSSAGRR